ncbi:MAG: hypothetical protein H0V13_00835 [Nocardioidaceae bacterium]|jgi:hypothetical protein|nr:hypothetical protein [Nocardioidaceae bacterium]
MTSDGTRRPTVDDVDPSVMAVNALPDETRMHGDGDETERVVLGDGSLAPTENLQESVEPQDGPSTPVSGDPERE